jgi:hypothetical protein
MYVKNPLGGLSPLIFTEPYRPTTPLVLTSLVAGETYSGTVPLTVEVDATLPVPTSVKVKLGLYERTCSRVGTTNVWQATAWDTTMKLVDTSVPVPSNSSVGVQATATIAGEDYTTGTYFVQTGNYDYGNLAHIGWRSEWAWAADYSSKAAFDASHPNPLVGFEYATIVDDPVFGAARKVLKATPPDNGSFGATGAPRFQSQSPSDFNEGAEWYVGWSIYIPVSSSSAYGSGGFPTVDLSRVNETNRHIAIFQMYGPQGTTPSSYPPGRGAITIIDANRRLSSDPIDRFHIEANQMNGGDPGFVIDFPYNRGAWTDIVMGFHMSADIKRGWIEAYINQGAHDSVRPMDLFGIPGLHRIPRVTSWPYTTTPLLPLQYRQTNEDPPRAITGGSRGHRTDMQIYRSPTAYQEATTYVTAHRIGPTPESVDPKTYA